MSEPSDPNIDQDAQLNFLRKEMASYLAQKLTFSLFQAGKTSELKQRIADLVEEKLLADEIPLESAQKTKLVNDIIAGMPTLQNDEIVAMGDVKDADNFTLEELQDIMRPFLATRLNDSLFDDDRKEDLIEAIEHHIDDKIKMDDIPVPADQRKELIAAICSNMGLNPEEKSEAEAFVPATPPPLVEKKDEEVAPHPVAVAAEEKPAPVAAKKPIPKPSAASMLPLKALTHEIKRDLLYNLSEQIDPSVMTGGDELALRAEIFKLIQMYCTEHKFMLNDQDVEKIVLEILSGEGLEFQL